MCYMRLFVSIFTHSAAVEKCRLVPFCLMPFYESSSRQGDDCLLTKGKAGPCSTYCHTFSPLYLLESSSRESVGRFAGSSQLLYPFFRHRVLSFTMIQRSYAPSFWLFGTGWPVVSRYAFSCLPLGFLSSINPAVYFFHSPSLYARDVSSAFL